MRDEDKTKKQLIEELTELRQRNGEVEASNITITRELLKALAGNSTTGIYIVQEGKMQFANAMFQKYVGYSEEELMGMDSLGLVSPGDRDMVREKVVQMLKGESSSPYAFRYIDRGRSSRWVMETVVPVRYQGKRASMGYFMDITSHKQAEEKYKQLLEDMNDGYVVLQEGIIVLANKRYHDIFGYEPGQLLGMSFAYLLPTEDHQAIMEWYEKVEYGEELAPELHEAVVVKKDGTRVIVQSSVKVIHYNGKPAFSNIVRDITEQKLADEDLIAAQKYARNLIDRSLDMIISVDRGRRIVEFNLAAQKAFGYNKGEVLGRHVNILYADPEEGLKAHETAEKVGRFTGEITRACSH